MAERCHDSMTQHRKVLWRDCCLVLDEKGSGEKEVVKTGKWRKTASKLCDATSRGAQPWFSGLIEV